jgi:hypothetical protein
VGSLHCSNAIHSSHPDDNRHGTLWTDGESYETGVVGQHIFKEQHTIRSDKTYTDTQEINCRLQAQLLQTASANMLPALGPNHGADLSEQVLDLSWYTSSLYLVALTTHK